MNILFEIREAFPRALQLILLAAVLTFSGGVANAQADDDEDAEATNVAQIEEEEGVIDEVITTGSRVVRDTFSSISPLQVVDGELARDLGLIDTADLLRQTTVVQGTQFTTGLTTSG